MRFARVRDPRFSDLTWTRGTSFAPIPAEHGPTTATADSPPGSARFVDDNKKRGNPEMKKLLLCTAAIAMFGATATQAEAQPTPTATVNATINLKIPTLLFIDVTNDNLVLPEPDFAQLEAGFTGPASHQVRHRGNVAHTITVAPQSGVTEWSGPTAKPAEDLQWSLDASSWNLVTASTKVGTGAKGGFLQNPNIPVWWRSAVDYNDEAGDYSIVVTYTSTSD